MADIINLNEVPAYDALSAQQAIAAPEMSVTDMQADAPVSDTKTEKKAESGTEEKKPVSGLEKLKKERKDAVSMLKGPMAVTSGQTYDYIFDHLIEKCRNDPAFDALVAQEQKTWQGCMGFLIKKVQESCNPTAEQKKAARDGRPIMVPVGPEDVLNFCEAYYQLDDREEWEKKKKTEADLKAMREKAIADSKARADKKKKTAGKKATTAATVSADPAPAPATVTAPAPAKDEKAVAPAEKAEQTVSTSVEKPAEEEKKPAKKTARRKDKDPVVDGQLSLFEMFG